MDFKEFYNYLKEESIKNNIEINEIKAKKFFDYMNILIEWNKKMNLTAITEPKDIIIKHFVDSITIEKYINNNSKIIDVGTGAGFPGIPLAIIREDLDIVLMDSLNKRITFLNEVIEKLQLKNVKAIHSRAEELARIKEYRENFDYATSRAVAPLNILLEYMLPFVKVNGYCICMKGSNIEDELNESKNALKILNGSIEKIENFILSGSDYNRNIIKIKKINNISGKYPRKSGTPKKEPIK